MPTLEARSTDQAIQRRRRRWWWVAAATVLVLAAAVGVVGWRELRFEARREAVPGAPFDLLIQPGTDPAQVAAVKDGLLAADRHLRTVLGAGADQRVEVRLAWSSGCEPFSSPAGPPTAWADAQQLCVHLKAPAWRSQFAKDPVLAQAVAAHEHVHNVQDQVGCLNRPGEHQRLWLSEGMAVHLAFQDGAATVRADGLLPLGRCRDALAGRLHRSLRPVRGRVLRPVRRRPPAVDRRTRSLIRAKAGAGPLGLIAAGSGIHRSREGVSGRQLTGGNPTLPACREAV